MTVRPVKIAITGTHSTGKSSFLEQVSSRLKQCGLVVERFESIAVKARSLGFPILKDHTIDSTLWIMAECMRLEAEASLLADVILIDRPVSDALGYLEAALEVSGRSVEPERLKTIQSIAQAYLTEYDVLIETILDLDVPIGSGRDPDGDLRLAAARHIGQFAEAYGPGRFRLSSTNQAAVLEQVIERIRPLFSQCK